MKTPFVFGKIASGAEFTDRETETASLANNFSGLTNTVIISPRRWGKSSLVSKAVEAAGGRDSALRFCQIDLFNVRSEEDFYRQLAAGVVKAAMPRWEEAVKQAQKFFRRLVPKISLSPEPGTEFTLDFDWEAVVKDPDEILDLAEKLAAEKKIKLIICIDEFQNIATFRDPLALQKKLRSHWQRHTHAAYCLYGSKRHMMMDVFTSPSMPFYKFGDVLYLHKISESDWTEFLVRRFRQTRKSISAESAGRIARLCECHPYYVQQLAQHSWLRTADACTDRIVDAAFESLILQSSLLFQTITDALATTQVNYLRALLEGAQNLSGKETIASYGLSSSANVSRIRHALIEKEIIENGSALPVFLDPIYREWLRSYYFRIRTLPHD